MKIYTRRGDRGETGLGDGQRVPKDDPRLALTGELDELGGLVGLARSLLPAGSGDLDPELAGLQRDLLALGSWLADPRRDGEDPSARDPSDRLSLGPERVGALEAAIDRWEAELRPLRRFILPGGCPAAAALHVARAVARRAERRLVSLRGRGLAREGALAWLNRASDFLFVAARLANRRAGRQDELW